MFLLIGGALHYHLRKVPQEDISKLGASAADSNLCGWVKVGTDVYVPHHRDEISPHSSTWFVAVCAAAIAHKNNFFCLY